MTLPDSAALANLARIGKLKAEPPDARERACRMPDNRVSPWKVALTWPRRMPLRYRPCGARRSSSGKSRL
jgi:hypothetical protein